MAADPREISSAAVATGRKQGAQDTLYRRYGTIVERVCRRYCRSSEEASDAAHDCFAWLILRWGKLDLTSCPESLLYKVARSCASTVARARRRAEALAADAPSTQFFQADLASLLESRIVLRDALHRLPPRQREILWARHFLGWTVEEIAQRLHLRASTVRCSLTRGLQALRDDRELARWDSAEWPIDSAARSGLPPVSGIRAE